MALHALRRRRGDNGLYRLARLRGRAVHAADGHHLRAAGVRAGAGIPVGRADGSRQAARPGEPPARRSQRHAVAGAWPRRGPAAVDRPAQSRTGGGQRGARLAVAAACRAAGRRRSGPPPTATRCARSATGWRSSLPMPRCRHIPVPRGWSSCSRISRRRPPAPMPRSRRPRQLRRSLPRRAGSLATPPPARRCTGAACRDAAPDRRTRQDGAGEQGHHRGEAVRPCHAGRAEPRARRAARYAGEAGAGRGRAGDDRPAASRRRRNAACRGEEARRFGAGADRACSTSRWTN